MEIQEIYFNACFGKGRNFYHASQESNRIITAVSQMEARMTEQKTEHHRRRRELSGVAAVPNPEKVISNYVTLAMEMQSYDFCDIISANKIWCNLETDNVYNIEKDFDVQFQFADHNITHESSIDIRHRVTISGNLNNVMAAAERFKKTIPINIAISLENLPPSVTLDKTVAKLQDWKDSECSKPFSNVEIMLFMPKLHGPIINDLTVNEDGVFKFIGSKGFETLPCIRVRGRASSKDDIAAAVKAVYSLVFKKPAQNDFNAITCYNLTDRVDEWLQRRPINEMAQFLADTNKVCITFPRRPTGDFTTTVSWMLVSTNVEGVVNAAAEFYDLLPCSIKIFAIPKPFIEQSFTLNIESLKSPVCTVLDQIHGVGIVTRVGSHHYDMDYIAPLGNLKGIVSSIQKVVCKGFSTSILVSLSDNAIGEVYRGMFQKITIDVAFPRAISCVDFHTEVPWHTVNPPLIRFIPFNQITRVLFERNKIEGNWTSENDDNDVFLPANPPPSTDIELPLCSLHNKPIITQYEHVQHHVTPRKDISQCVDATVKFWLKGTTPCEFEEEAKEPTNSDNKIHVPLETLFTSIQPSLKSKSRRKAERVKQTVLGSKAIHASELESKLVFEASPLTPITKRETTNCPTPIDQREVPSTAYIAKFILERVPRSCMSYNFYQYHMLTLFHGDMAAKGALDNYPFCSRTMAFPPGKPMTESDIVQCLGVHFDGDDTS